MNKFIAFKMQDGSCGITFVSPEWVGREEELAELTSYENVCTEWQNGVCVSIEKVFGEWVVIDISELPQSIYFRAAWRVDPETETLSVDMPTAREIHMQEIRRVRDEKLKALDVEQLKGNNVSAEKQALRDLPQTFDLTVAETPEALKALWPEELS